MVKSRFSSTLWLWGAFSLLLLYIACRLFLSANGTLIGTGIMLFSVGSVFGAKVILFANVTIIDSLNKTVSYKNIITRKKKVFYYDEINGYITTTEFTKGGDCPVIYLLSKDKYVVKMSSYIYSNYADLKHGLADIKYLRPKYTDIIDRSKILLGYNASSIEGLN